mmetsp:Transcript_31438/g.67524  ORF Transcript_31438/g.67524 Transcript_31438/m.67524 type:complete len:521 (-) Transcript_31438:489-2051(-)
MRDNTNAEVKAYVQIVAAYKDQIEEYFDYDAGQHRIDPELVILGGDISADADTSVKADWPIWEELEKKGIAFIAGFGNHDYDKTYNFNSDTENANTVKFCRASYKNASVVGSPYFGYQEFGPTDSRGLVTFLASYKGIQIVNFNSFLYEQGYHYDFESDAGQACAANNAEVLWAGCQVYTSAEAQIQEMEGNMSSDETTPTLVVQHYPLDTSVTGDWWVDGGASGKTQDEMQTRLLDITGRYNSSVLLTGHEHAYRTTSYTASNGRTLSEYVAPYFGGANGVDLSVGGGFLAILVSKSAGILEVKHVPSPWVDGIAETTTTGLRVPSTTAAAQACEDEEILPSSAASGAKACVTSNCLTEALFCSMDTTCAGIAAPFLTSAAMTHEEAAGVLWEMKDRLSTNDAIKAIAVCADENCGSNVLGATCHDKYEDLSENTVEITTTLADESVATTTIQGGGSGSSDNGGDGDGSDTGSSDTGSSDTSTGGNSQEADGGFGLRISSWTFVLAAAGALHLLLVSLS